MDGANLDVIGEVHAIVYRDKLELTFSALVVKNMATDALAGTGFHRDNDVYSRMATDKIVVQGKNYFNPHLHTPNPTHPSLDFINY